MVRLSNLFTAAACCTAVAANPTSRKMLEMVDKEFMASMIDQTFLNTTLTSLSTNTPNRYYNDANGVTGSKFLFDMASAMIADRPDVSIRYFDHSWAQPSIILRIEGTSDATEMVILGAHCDSVSNSPGANDDGSGSITLMQALKIFMDSDFTPARPVELHWYAAEEAGLLGSKAVAADYKANNKEVLAMLQVDMDAHITATKIKLSIVQTSGEVTDLLENLIAAYSGTCCGNAGPLPTVRGLIPGGSDHSSWTANGYPSAFGIEEPLSSVIHTPNDSMANVNIAFMAAYVPVPMAFVTELSQLCPAAGEETCVSDCSFEAKVGAEAGACAMKCAMIC